MPNLNVDTFKTKLSEPLRSNLYVVYIPFAGGIDGTGNYEIGGAQSKSYFFCKSVKLPEMTMEATDVTFLNRKIKYAGGRTTAEIEMTFWVESDMELSLSMEAWLNNIQSGLSVSGSPPERYKKTIDVFHLRREGGRRIRGKRIIGAWPQTIAGFELGFDQEGPAELSVTFSYDTLEELSANASRDRRVVGILDGRGDFRTG